MIVMAFGKKRLMITFTYCQWTGGEGETNLHLIKFCLSVAVRRIGNKLTSRQTFSLRRKKDN